MMKGASGDPIKGTSFRFRVNAPPCRVIVRGTLESGWAAALVVGPDGLDAAAEWSGERRMKFSDITEVDFGGGYEEALALTAPKRPKTRE